MTISNSEWEIVKHTIDERRGKEGGKLRSVTTIARILGKKVLCDLGFETVVSSKIMALQAIMLNRVEEELPSTTDIGKADDIELQEIMENAARRTENLIVALQGLETLPLYKLLGFDKELRNIMGLPKGGGSRKGSVERTHQVKKAHGNPRQPRIQLWHLRRHQMQDRQAE